MSESQQRMMVFVSHAHEDDAYCRVVVEGLRGAGADVWYDEHNLGSGQLMEVIQRELGRRPVVVVILSKAAFASAWVRREVTWAYELLDRDPSRLIMPVTAGPLARDDFDPTQGWLFLHDFKRIEASGLQPYAAPEAVQRLLQALALTLLPDEAGSLSSSPAADAPAASVSRATPAVTAESPAMTSASRPEIEDLDDLLRDGLLGRGKALSAQGKYAEALPLFERATNLAPHSFDAWFNLGAAFDGLKRYGEALAAFEQAITLDPTNAGVWEKKGYALRFGLHRDTEALAAYEQVTTLDPTNPHAWFSKGQLLDDLSREEEALAAYEHAIALDQDGFFAWKAKAHTLYALERYEEALATFERLTSLHPYSYIWSGHDEIFGDDKFEVWFGKGETLSKLHRYKEAVEAFEQATTVNVKHIILIRDHDGLREIHSASAWIGKADALYALKSYKAALAAYEQALTRSPHDWNAWVGKGETLYQLHRYKDALAVYEQATTNVFFRYNARMWTDKARVLRKLWRWREAKVAERQAEEAKVAERQAEVARRLAKELGGGWGG